jgi:3'-phosphoadenosine 5'-phosphosulfate sulfotransferase (PAPS reductase)/FAD synthetase
MTPPARFNIGANTRRRTARLDNRNSSSFFTSATGAAFTASLAVVEAAAIALFLIAITFFPPENCLFIIYLEDNSLEISDMCCVKLKEEPLMNWAKANMRDIAIIGIMRDEGGRRTQSTCLQFSGKKLKKFQPLVSITKEWEEWFIDAYNVEICDIYKPPYNFERTGCKGCPFNIHLQKELDVLEKYFPNEKKQCEIIWKPVYDEYRRLGYRLKNNSYKQVQLEVKKND